MILSMDISKIQRTIDSAACSEQLINQRFELVRLAAEVFDEMALFLASASHTYHGSSIQGNLESNLNVLDECVAVAMLLSIASQLTGGFALLFSKRQHYAAAALLRQLVEVKYLAWAFAVNDSDASKWLRSTKREREEFFRLARLRSNSGGRFRNKDYSYHCELGGHPDPRSYLLFEAQADRTGQLLLADALGHIGHIWNHVAEWAVNTSNVNLIEPNAQRLPLMHRRWSSADPLSKLPPPP
jgi:hypothetical protein